MRVEDIPVELLSALRSALEMGSGFQAGVLAYKAGMPESIVTDWLKRLREVGWVESDGADTRVAAWWVSDSGKEVLRWRETPRRANTGNGRPKYQFFISSPFKDLHEERRAVIFEILAARHIPAGMEDFPANDDRGWTTIQRTIDVSDYYIVIVGGLYGSIDESTGISWTEREYDYARSKSIKVLALLRDQQFVPGDKVETDPTSKAKLDAFRDKLKHAHHVKDWTTVDDLRAKVIQAINAQIHDDADDGTSPAGWYRGDQVPAVRDLQAKLDEEQARVEKLERELHHHQTVRRLKPGVSSGKLGTGEVRFEVDAPIKKWIAYHASQRRITVNGVLVSPGGPLPEPSNGKYTFAFGDGEPAWMSWQYWDETMEELDALRNRVKELENTAVPAASRAVGTALRIWVQGRKAFADEYVHTWKYAAVEDEADLSSGYAKTWLPKVLGEEGFEITNTDEDSITFRRKVF